MSSKLDEVRHSLKILFSIFLEDDVKKGRKFSNLNARMKDLMEMMIKLMMVEIREENHLRVMKLMLALVVLLLSLLSNMVEKGKVLVINLVGEE